METKKQPIENHVNETEQEYIFKKTNYVKLKMTLDDVESALLSAFGQKQVPLLSQVSEELKNGLFHDDYMKIKNRVDTINIMIMNNNLAAINKYNDTIH